MKGILFRLFLLLLAVILLLAFGRFSHAQNVQPQKVKVQFDTPNSQVSSNGLQQALQAELGDNVEVLGYTTQHDDFHATLRFVRADLSALNQTNPSAWRSGLGSGAIILFQSLGQTIASGAYRHGGVLGSAAGAAISTGSSQASQGAYKSIVYKRHRQEDVPLYYVFCNRTCLKESAIWYRVRQDNDPSSGQSRWLLLGYGLAKDQIINFPKDEAVYLYEGAGGFYRQDLLQELLFRFLLQETGSEKPRLVGALQLASFLRDVKAFTTARFDSGAANPTAAVPNAKPSVDPDEARRRQVAATLSSGNMVPMHSAPQQQSPVPARRCTRDELVQDTAGNWVCPPQAASAAPVVVQPLIASGMDKDGEQPFSRIVQFVFGKDDMMGHDVDLMINLLRNKGYLTVPGAKTWNQSVAEDWRRMEEAFVAIGAPLTADGRLTVTEFAYWRDVLAKYPNDFASPVRR